MNNFMGKNLNQIDKCRKRKHMTYKTLKDIHLVTSNALTKTMNAKCEVLQRESTVVPASWTIIPSVLPSLGAQLTWVLSSWIGLGAEQTAPASFLFPAPPD